MGAGEVALVELEEVELGGHVGVEVCGDSVEGAFVDLEFRLVLPFTT